MQQAGLVVSDMEHPPVSAAAKNGTARNADDKTYK